MSDHGDQLREAFGTHENDTPDPAVVYARVQQLSQTYRRRRRGAQLAGGAVLGAGLLVGAFQVPALISNPAANDVTMVAPAAPAAPSSAAALTPAELAQKAVTDAKGVDAYFAAGYGLEAAAELAAIWKMDADDLSAVKAEAGQRLLDGKTLPVQPDPAALEAAEDDARYDAFFNAGYDYDSATELAKIWKLDDPSEAKVKAGQWLLDGKKVPVDAEPVQQPTAQENDQVTAFFGAGYDVDDAAELAKLWKLGTPYDAKVAGGKKLLAGEALPIRP